LRTAALHAAAVELFLARGLDAVTLEDIATAADMSKSNFYRYAKDKDELVEDIVAPIRDAIFEAYDRCRDDCAAAVEPRELTAAYMTLAFELLRLIDSEKRVVMFFLQEARGPDVGPRQPIRAFERSIIERSIELTLVAHEHGTLKKIPPAVSAHIVVGAVERLLLAYLRDGVFRNAAEVVQALVRLVMEGIVG